LQNRDSKLIVLAPVRWLLVMDTDAIPVPLKKEIGRNLNDVPTYWYAGSIISSFEARNNSGLVISWFAYKETGSIFIGLAI